MPILPREDFPMIPEPLCSVVVPLFVSDERSCFIPSIHNLDLDSPREDFPLIPGPLCFVVVLLYVFDEGPGSYHHQMTLTLTHLMKIFPRFQGLCVLLWFCYMCLMKGQVHTITRWPWPWLTSWRFSHDSRASVFCCGSVICVWWRARFIPSLDDLDLDSPHGDFSMIPGPLCFVVVLLYVFDEGPGSYHHQMTLTLTHLMKIFPRFQGLCVLWWFCYMCLMKGQVHTITRWPWPWLTSWRFSHDSRASVFCGGSVICVWCRDRFILSLDDLDIRGEVSRSSSSVIDLDPADCQQKRVK